MKTIHGGKSPLAHLAMSLALIAIPMQAMAQGQGGNGERGGEHGPHGGGWAGRGAPGNAAPAPAAPAARPAAPAPAAPPAQGPAQGGWNGGQRGPDRGAIGGGWHGGPGNPGNPGNPSPQGGNGQRNDAPRPDASKPGNESWRGSPGWPPAGGGYNRGTNPGNGPGNGPGWNGNRGPGANAPRGDYRRWTQDWRRDNRYDWQGYRASNRMVFHVGRYYPPYHGYAYRRLSVGLFLQPLFYSQSYVIYDPYNYRLPAVYGPYQWVRYYDDALLVDTYTGQVVDVLYDFFW